VRDRIAQAREQFAAVGGDVAIVHYHLRPGGVRRVIELATLYLANHCAKRIGTVLLGTGEAPDAGWLRDFRARLPGTQAG